MRAARVTMAMVRAIVSREVLMLGRCTEQGCSAAASVQCPASSVQCRVSPVSRPLGQNFSANAPRKRCRAGLLRIQALPRHHHYETRLGRAGEVKPVDVSPASLFELLLQSVLCPEGGPEIRFYNPTLRVLAPCNPSSFEPSQPLSNRVCSCYW